MFGYRLTLACFILAPAYASSKDVGSISTTTKKTPELKTRFFGLENILGQIFHGPNYPSAAGFGGQFQFMPGYQNQQSPQGQFNNWQNMQTPNQAQSKLDQYPQSGTPYPQGDFNSQNNFGASNLNIQSPQQFPNQQSMDQYPSQSITQGNFNPGNNVGQNQNFNTGKLEGVPSQNGLSQINQPSGSWKQNPGFQAGTQNGGFQNPNGRFQNQNGGLQNQNGGFQNQNGGFQNQNGLGLQNENPQNTADYNPVAILGKPVPMTTSVPDSIVFQDGCDTPTQRQCVQDCQSTSEYEPVCGSNNVTYFNPGRFICARNCGINVFIQRHGRCDA